MVSRTESESVRRVRPSSTTTSCTTSCPPIPQAPGEPPTGSSTKTPVARLPSSTTTPSSMFTTTLRSTSTANVYGIVVPDSPNHTVQNNIVIDSTKAVSGNAQDYCAYTGALGGGEACSSPIVNATFQYNMSSDLSAIDNPSGTYLDHFRKFRRVQGYGRFFRRLAFGRQCQRDRRRHRPVRKLYHRHR